MKLKRFGCLFCVLMLLVFVFFPNNILADEVPHTDGNGIYSSESVLEGESGQTLTVMIAFWFDAYEIATNCDEYGDYIDDVGSNAFTQTITEYITYLKAGINSQTAYDENMSKTTSPIKSVNIRRSDIITKTSSGKIRNYGYAVFSLTLKSKLKDGDYYIPIVFTGEEKKEDGTYHNFKNEEFMLTISIKNEKSSNGSSSGGGSGGGGGVEAASPTAKLIIDGVRTEPKEPKAGKELDIILTLKNTSEKLYLQNIKLKYEAEDDAVLPVNGASSLYIPKIEANSTMDVTLKVKAKADMEDKPVKLSIEMDFQDSKLEALSESQQVIINVLQPQRIKVDDPVYPTGSVYPGESYEISVKVYNMGKPLIYNLTARIVSDDPNLIPGAAVYGGNMDPATEKACELEVAAMEPGSYDATLLITYETAAGEEKSIRKALSVYIDEEIETGYTDMDDLPEPTPEPDPMALTIMKALPWWIYAFLAGILVMLIISMGIGARRRKRRALEDDEMD